jgi:RNA recognition motif-containing protein
MSTTPTVNNTTTPDCNTLFVGGLSESTKKETLESYFSTYGPITEVNLIIDWVTGKSKRCAIVFCQDGETTAKILGFKGHCIDDRKVRVDKADSKKKGTKIVKTTKIFLGHVHPSISELELKDYFTSYGAVKHMKLIKNNFLPHSGGQNGFLEFFDQSQAQKLLNDRHNLYVKGFKLFCQPFRAKNAQEGEFLNMISNMGGPKLEQYLQIYFSMQMQVNMSMDSDPDQETTQGFNMNMMPAMAFMMQNIYQNPLFAQNHTQGNEPSQPYH